jgi:RNA polymerase-binding transcription factor DksA
MSTNMQTIDRVPNAGLIWGRLHTEREEICEALLSEPPKDTGNSPEFDANEESSRDVEFKRRELLQARLRHIDDALDRLLAGGYGHCSDCNSPIEDKRLDTDPATAFCIACQEYTECEDHFRTL